MSSLDAYITFFSSVSQVFSLLWLASSVRSYSDKFFDYKTYLTSLAIANFVFSIVFNWLLDIEVLFPYAGFKVTGFLRYVPDLPACRMLIIGITFALIGHYGCVVFEIICVRVLVVYQKHGMLKNYGKTLRIVCNFIGIILPGIGGAALAFYDMGGYEVIENAEPSWNMTSTDGIIFAMTITLIQFQDLATYCIMLFALCSIFGLLICYVVYPAAKRRQNNLNTETQDNEKPFTIFLMIQCLMPVFCMCSFFLAAILSWSTKAQDNRHIKYIPRLCWIFYPFVASLSAMHYIEPYSRYISRLFGCNRRAHSVVPSIVVHGAENSRPGTAAAAPAISVISTNDIFEPGQPEQGDIYGINLKAQQPQESLSARLVVRLADSPRRMSLATEIIQNRQRRPSVFSRFSYFL